MRLSTGEWQAHRTHAQVRWLLDGQQLALNAHSVSIYDAPGYNYDRSLSGHQPVYQVREYAETMADGSVRPAVLYDVPKKLELTFPRLPNDFLFFLRPYRTFSIPFTIEFDFFTALDPEPLYTADGEYYYASCGAWKEGTVQVFRNGASVTDGFYTDLAKGFLRFSPPFLSTDAVTVAYTWAPTVVVTGELGLDWKSQKVRPQSEVKITLQEILARRIALPELFPAPFIFWEMEEAAGSQRVDGMGHSEYNLQERSHEVERATGVVGNAAVCKA
jgi:hypothetical protein